MKPAEILDIPEKLYSQYRMSPKFLESVMETFGIQSTGKDVLEKEFGLGPMRYFVSNSRHYSWPKAGGKCDHIVENKIAEVTHSCHWYWR